MWGTAALPPQQQLLMWGTAAASQTAVSNVWGEGGALVGKVPTERSSDHDDPIVRQLAVDRTFRKLSDVG
jgi:hypothetical protein